MREEKKEEEEEEEEREREREEKGPHEKRKKKRKKEDREPTYNLRLHTLAVVNVEIKGCGGRTAHAHSRHHD